MAARLIVISEYYPLPVETACGVPASAIGVAHQRKCLLRLAIVSTSGPLRRPQLRSLRIDERISP
jgi:hypothetical protein